MSQLQEDVLNRIKQDIEVKTNNQEETLLNTRLQQSVEELNVKFPIEFICLFSIFIYCSRL